MKKLFLCPRCERIRRVVDSYSVEITLFPFLNYLIKKANVTGQEQKTSCKALLCKTCAALAGYRVSGVNVFKTKEVVKKTRPSRVRTD